MLKNIRHQLRMLKKNKKFVWPTVTILAAILIGGSLILAFGGNGAEGQTALVARGDIGQQVSVAGTLKPVEEVELSFNRSGKVVQVLADVGAKVEAGQTIVRLDNRDAAIELEEAKIAYEDLVKVDPLDATKARNEVQEFEADLASSYDAARAILSSEIKELNDAVNTLDDLFSSDGYLSSINFNAGSIPEERRDDAEKSFNKSKQAVKDFLKTYQSSFASSDPKIIQSTITELYQVATICSGAVKEAKDIVTYLKEQEYGDEEEVEEAYESVSDLAVLVSDSVDNIFTAKNDVLNNERLLSEAKLDLADLLDGPDATDLRSSRLAIQQKEKDYSDYFLTSPIGGVVVTQEAKVGEQVSSGSVIVSVISANNLEIEANVPEVDIARVAVGYDVDINFDAFPDEHFTGKVVMIDPAQTVIDGVVNFKVTISLDTPGEKLKSGLTANIEIKSVLAQNVLLVPRAALIDRAGNYFVNVISGRQIEERQVEIGAIGQIGNVEVVSGLTEGEMVLVRQ